MNLKKLFVSQNGQWSVAARYAVASVVFALVCAAAFWAEWQYSAAGVTGKWMSVTAPLLAVTMAIATRRLFLSMISAIVLGGLLSAYNAGMGFATLWDGPLRALGFSFSAVYKIPGPGVEEPGFQFGHLRTLTFVVLILSMVSIMVRAGGMNAIARALDRYAKGRRSAKFATVLMGVAVFFDDYAHSMIVGSTMRPVTDRQGVSREKLAFLVDSTSAPIAGIAIISTWVGYEVGLFDKQSEALSLGVGGFSMLLDALGFRFYCLMMLGFVFINSAFESDFGPMRKAEERAKRTGQISAPDAKLLTVNFFRPLEVGDVRVRLISAVLPLATLMGVMVGMLWTTGGGWGRVGTHGFGALFSATAWRETLGDSKSSLSLLTAGLCGLPMAAISALVFARQAPKDMLRSGWIGAVGGLFPIAMLILSWSIDYTCKNLKTADFMVEIIHASIAPTLFPALLFIAACLTSFATGTSYGTMGILIPIGIPVAHAFDGGVYGPITIVCLAAVLDGAIFGDHCSPISETTMMSSIASQCDHIHHVTTQLPYSLFVAGLALFVGYGPAAMLGLPWWGSLGLAYGITAGLFWFLRLRRGTAPRNA